jgi:hypothetical protein
MALYERAGKGEDTPALWAEITKLETESRDKGLYQGENAAVSIAADGKATLHALQNPDASSAVHELGHIWRRQLPAEDDATITAWEKGDKEKFARGLERYLYTGEAPTPALKSIFARFRDWLRSIYRKLLGSPIDVQISPEVKGVYDRMFSPAPSTETRLAKEAAKAEGPMTRAKFRADLQKAFGYSDEVTEATMALADAHGSLPVGDRYLHADDRRDAVLRSRLRPAHHAAEVVVIGEGDGGEADRGGAGDEVLGVGGAIEQREAGMTVELRVHQKTHGRTDARTHRKGAVCGGTVLVIWRRGAIMRWWTSTGSWWRGSIAVSW